MAVNANGRAIRVVPAIDEEGMRDKVVILRTHKADIYLREQGDTANKKRLDAYKAELPAFAYWLQKEFCVPAELPVGCSLGRSGALVYRDQEAMQMLHDESPARQLEYLLLEYIDYLVDLIKTHGNPKAVSESGNGGIEPMTTSKIRKLIAEKDKLIFKAGNVTQEFTRIDAGKPGELSGAWLITGRMVDGNIQKRTPGARKTMKILSGTRFQWIAYNNETKEFFGTGGGTYTTQGGKYTETIEFFSRDNSRVGAKLEFEFSMIDDDWRHSGKSSKGDPIDEIWSKREKIGL